jgi:hypothetical protein
MSPADAAPYEALARNLERELELIGQGHLDALAPLHAEREALIETLPATPPAGARPALQRAALLNKRIEVELTHRLEALLADLAQVERVDRTARGYAPPREPHPHVQATA